MLNFKGSTLLWKIRTGLGIAVIIATWGNVFVWAVVGGHNILLYEVLGVLLPILHIAFYVITLQGQPIKIGKINTAVLIGFAPLSVFHASYFYYNLVYLTPSTEFSFWTMTKLITFFTFVLILILTAVYVTLLFVTLLMAGKQAKLAQKIYAGFCVAAAYWMVSVVLEVVLEFFGKLSQLG